MPITMVELQGAIPRQQDFQQMKQMEAQKVMADNSNYQSQVQKNTEQNARQVTKKEDALFGDNESNQNKNEYQGDGGRHRPGKKEDRVVEKKMSSFDIKI